VFFREILKNSTDSLLGTIKVTNLQNFKLLHPWTNISQVVPIVWFTIRKKSDLTWKFWFLNFSDPATVFRVKFWFRKYFKIVSTQDLLWKGPLGERSLFTFGGKSGKRQQIEKSPDASKIEWCEAIRQFLRIQNLHSPKLYY